MEVCKKALVNSKQLERIYLKKHQFVSDTKIFVNENLAVKNEHLAFNYRLLKKGTIYLAHLQIMAPFILNQVKILGHW